MEKDEYQHHMEWVRGLETRIHALSKLLREVSQSGVELCDKRMSYAVVQIDSGLWQEIQAFRNYGESQVAEKSDCIKQI